MKRLLLLALIAPTLFVLPQPARAQSNIYEWSAAINLGFSVINQLMAIQRQLQPSPYDYGLPYGGQGFGMSGPPGWHLRGQQHGWGPPGWHLRGQQHGWGPSCQGQLMQDPMGRRAIVDPCTGQVLQWVR